MCLVRICTLCTMLMEISLIINHFANLLCGFFSVLFNSVVVAAEVETET